MCTTIHDRSLHRQVDHRGSGGMNYWRRFYFWENRLLISLRHMA